MSLRVEREGAAAWIRWSRPERLNAWDRATLAALGDALAEAGASDARAIVLHGDGDAFSAGDDLRETATLTPEEWAATLAGFNRLTREVVAASQPVIAAVDGVCVGGACELAAACDIRVASPASRFGCPEVAIGLSISNGFSLLAPRAARRLVLTGELVERRGGEAGRAGRLSWSRTLRPRPGDSSSASRRSPRSPSPARSGCSTSASARRSSARSTARPPSASSCSRPPMPTKGWRRSSRSGRPASRAAETAFGS